MSGFVNPELRRTLECVRTLVASLTADYAVSSNQVMFLIGLMRMDAYRGPLLVHLLCCSNIVLQGHNQLLM